MRKSFRARPHDSIFPFFNPFVLFFLALMATLVTAGSPYAADPFVPADIRVTDTVLTQNVEPIGANLTTIAGGTNFAINNHVWNSGFEPMMLRKFIRIDRAGSNWFEWDNMCTTSAMTTRDSGTASCILAPPTGCRCGCARRASAITATCASCFSTATPTRRSARAHRGRIPAPVLSGLFQRQMVVFPYPARSLRVPRPPGLAGSEAEKPVCTR